MSVESNTITLFVIDISARMGETRTVEDRIVTETQSFERRTRSTTHLQWVCEFISTRIAEVILRGLKTTRVAIITYGSPRTNNSIPDLVDYQGIDEIFLPALPTLDTLDLVQSLRAVHSDQKAPNADPLAALVDAIQLSSETEKGGIKASQKNTWKRTVYLITDGRSTFSYDGADAIQQKLQDENISLRLLGVDFDDPKDGLKLEGNDKVKQRNEHFWQQFLAQIPTAGFATAASALAQSAMPNIQVTKPAPSKTILSFGHPEGLPSDESFQIPIALYKMTDVARPMTQSKISRLARETSDAEAERKREEARRNRLNPTSTPTALVKDEGPESTVVYRADLKREYFLLDQLAAVANAKQEPEPLPADSESSFTRAWKLGASLIPVPDESFGNMETHKSMEILHFVNASAYRREYNMDQIWYAFADHAQIKAQLQVSTLVKAMVEMGVLAVVRLVRKDGAEPELGILKPKVEDHNDYFFYTKAPFREDLRRFPFPPLDRVITTDGTELRTGPTIPDNEDQEAMDAFVDSLELPDKWFGVLDSCNPAIHGLKTAVRHRFVHPDAKHLPSPHPELVKFLEAPLKVRKKATDAANLCRDRFKIAYVPPKGNADRKKRTLSAMQDDARAGASKSQAEGEISKFARLETTQGGAGGEESQREKRINVLNDEDDSATEDEGESASVPTAKLESPSLQIISTRPLLRLSDPVKDLLDKVEKDDVTKAMTSLYATINHLTEDKKYGLVAECMKAGKKVAQEYEEAINWNSFVRGLKKMLLKRHKEFWEGTVKGNLELGLVTEKEDEAGQSDVTPEDARVFTDTEEI
ncbi:related to ATP-dependent DNA helicase II, 80 kDa subunit [Melanopsichium pennsylvanicum]|uniref:ATP-dependent DNA helicase II subunit 2 n=2 Tax=Melanopsichium pennsylvanicum TaxID=63383 RepID=A0AAJ4XR14_9BASI|nr:related to ATP-dependent DNA helicase II, 80 kDa subunit [Melanopsichium pennsylvanicum 4]SNX86905.1 related to ATP-dependent DNA helicase II, 80 kDa subunit [Melanopsichium pennsylvanicum]